ncbi:STAS domain-containing protein [Nocardioides solisilvae]|uniref:STAS domain-containing protein n=1 Tax=Nocardioides solisilvae TaxID=1542435 RepID=UPI0013A53286|nr:STAS domain-containing protein [Nocardioides solisilvae]
MPSPIRPSLGPPAAPTLSTTLTGPRRDTVVLTLVGEADLATAALLWRALADAAHADARHVVVDLDQVAFLDAGGLRLLVMARQRTVARGGTLTLRCPGGRCRRLLLLAGLGGLLEPDRPLAHTG